VNKIKSTKIYKFLNRDIKEFNSFILSFVCIAILVGAGILSYFMNSSYALFSDKVVGGKTIEIVVGKSGTPNAPVLSDNMIPVYYDSSNGVWRKADSTNQSEEHKWYDYDNKMWANVVTVYESSIFLSADSTSKDSIMPNQLPSGGDSSYDTVNLVGDDTDENYIDIRADYLAAAPGTEINMDYVNTMLVWIPRFKYTVWNYNLDGTVTSEPQEIKIEFEEGTLSTGEIGCTDSISGTSDGTSSGTPATVSEVCKLKSNNTECTDATCNGKTYTHPAFTFGDEELEGFWVGKFEVSSDGYSCSAANFSAVGEGCNLTSITPVVKPNVVPWLGAMVGTFDQRIRQMTDDYYDIYGFETGDDTHMIKNMEWGAVAYLSHSKYGVNGKISLNSYEDYLTGCGPQSADSDSDGEVCNSYETALGQSSSTTGNIYGVYDMNGGSFDMTMGNMVSPNGVDMLSGYNGDHNSFSGYTGIVYNNSAGNYTSYSGTFTYPNDKYYDKYSFSLTRAGFVGSSKLGDGIKEVLNVSSSYGWHNSSFQFQEYEGSWWARGGHYSLTEDSGLFSSHDTYGSAYGVSSTRLIVS